MNSLEKLVQLRAAPLNGKVLFSALVILNRMQFRIKNAILKI